MTDDLGYFRLDVPERYAAPTELRALARGYTRADRSIDLENGSASAIDFSLAPQAEWTAGSVKARGGNYLPGVRVSSPSALTFTNGEGRFHLKGQPSDMESISLMVSADGYFPAHITFRRDHQGSPIFVDRRIRILGKLERSDDRPVTGATAELLAGSQIVSTSSVSASGQFSFEGVRPDRYLLRVSGNGMIAVTKALVVSDAHSTIDLGQLSLMVQRRISGEVIDDAGQPISGAAVFFMTDPESREHPPVPRAPSGAPLVQPTDTTNFSGRFEIEGPAIPGTLEVWKTGYAPERSEALPQPEGGFQIVLNEAQPLEVKVLDDFGAPIEGATITTLPRHFEGSSSPWKTDEDGTVVIQHAWTPLRILAMKEGFAQDMRDVVGSHTEEVTLVLPAEAVLTGRVSDETGTPLHNAQVTVLPERGMPLGTTSALEGDYELGSLQVGTALVEVKHSGFESLEQALTLTPGTQERDFELVRTIRGSLAGTIAADIELGESASLLLWNQGTGESVYGTVRDGKFSIDEIGVGKYSVALVGSKCIFDEDSQTVTVEEGVQHVTLYCFEQLDGGSGPDQGH